MTPKKAQATKARQSDKLASRSKPVRGDKHAEQEAEVENNNAAEEPEPQPEPESEAKLEAESQQEAEPDTKREPDEDPELDIDAEADTEPEPKPKPKPEPDTKQEADAAHTGQKRKKPPTSRSGTGTKGRPKKVPRQGSRSSSRTAGNPATPKQLLNFLLSAQSLPYCFPAEEFDAASNSPSEDFKSYSRTWPTSFTPFEHLVCAHLLAKPLSHVLGMRSIRTLLNEPYALTTPEKILKGGEKRVWEALEAARTQHRQKTASYIFGMAQAYADSETMFALAEEANGEGPVGVIRHVKNTVPGLGNVGGQIFCRRIQCVDGWGDALWPYADSKALEAVREVGIDVEDAEELQGAIEEGVDWSLVGDMGLQGGSKGEKDTEMETRVQAEFVVVLERALGCVLEGKVVELRRAAVKAFS